MSLLIGLLLTVALLTLFDGIRRVRVSGYAGALQPYGGARGAQRPRTRYERWVRPFARRLSGFGLLRVLVDTPRIERELVYAGNPAGMDADEFYGVQVYGALVGLLVGALWLLSGLFFGAYALALLPIAGFYYPRLWLSGRVKRRQAAITVALPDLLDMLAVCVSAGMGFDVALGLLVERGSGPLYEELERLLSELRIGEPRQSAFRNLATRNSSRELQQFVETLLQAEELGTPIAATLERQAEDMRVERRQRAREQGARASNQISLVMVFAIMPSILCLILGGLVISFFSGGGAGLFSGPQ
jgi:tight adherence protein C